ncbi:hypothetical protein F0562_001601 [Nyssa sinensis]|uniref:Uncharacterized protein n=1 Tax=Nyssa sinensis TaxID=561372 RepID=A0A5J5C7M4_9ASTE|nr:hypothetical protein F0562_001601 [Nyssa sinensis]
MSKQNLDVVGRIGGQCNIRKRGCSSSSSSSLVQNYRLKRAFLVGKRGRSSMPVPLWMVASRPPSCALRNGASMKNLPSKNGESMKEVSLSARKLAATLWEINEVPSPPLNKNKMQMRNRERIVKSSKLCSMQSHLSDPSHSPGSERMDRYRDGSHRRRTSIVPDLGGLDSIYTASTIKAMQIENQSRRPTPGRYIVGVETRFEGSLRAELDRARIQVDQLIQEQRSNHGEIDYLLKQFAEEKAAWKRKEQDRIYNAIASIAGELNVEKKLRRQTERLNKKLGRELAGTKVTLSKAVKELESEKRAREILQQVCDELARGIGEDRAEVEELKRESVKVREEVEKERQMLQLADVLREERVQMKLSDAKYQFEEKNAAVDKMRNELEAYLRSKLGEEKGDGFPNFDRSEELEFFKKTLLRSCQNGDKEKDEGEVVNGEDYEGDDSGDSDLHSIELSMDNNSKSYNWSFSCGAAAQDDMMRTSVDGKIKGRKSISEKIKSSISLERTISDGIEWDFSTRSQKNSDVFDTGRSFNITSQAWKKDCEDEIERYKMVKDLRDHILSGSRIASSQGFASPTRHWGQSLPSQDHGGMAYRSSTVLQESGLQAMLEGIKGERQSSTHLGE